ncbi:MAG: hypothetical protein U0174_13335 [Polyangiaceae bacterium]
MGRECVCNARFSWVDKGASREGKALLEEGFVAFRGEPRVKLLREDIQTMIAKGDELVVSCNLGKAHFALGEKEAKKWCERFLTPPSLTDKFGIAAGTSVALVGKVPAFVAAAVRDAGALPSKAPTAKTQVVLVAATSESELAKAVRVAEALEGAQRLWILYPKGNNAFPESLVRKALLGTGLVDNKTARVDDVWTSLQFVVRKGER